MSKDFRQEYEKYMKENTPDLWERIDAGLSEKKTAASSEQEKALPKRRAGRMYKVMTAAAALLFAAVLMPFVYKSHMGEQGNNTEAASPETAQQMKMGGMPEDEAEGAASAEGSPEIFPGAGEMGGGITEEGNQGSPSGEDETDTAGQAASKDSLISNLSESGQDEKQDLGGESDQESKQGTEDSAGDMQDKIRQEGARQEAANAEAALAVEIYKVIAGEEVACKESDDGNASEALPVSRVYRAQIQDTDRIITVAVPEGMSLTLTEGGAYALSLKAAEKNSGYEYIIVSVE